MNSFDNLIDEVKEQAAQLKDAHSTIKSIITKVDNMKWSLVRLMLLLSILQCLIIAGILWALK